MKKQSGKTLVEILAVELKEWPDIVASFGCDTDGEIRAYDEHGGADEYHNQIDFYPEVPVASEDRANGYGALASPVLVTREMWEAERAKLSKPKANAQGWVRHRGRKNPFNVCTLVDARLRSGQVVTGKFSENLHWVHTGNNFDVMAYRVNESVEAAAPEVTATNDGPLQWRDRVTEIDREVEALEEERESLIQKLADEGLQLLRDFAMKALKSAGLPDPKDQSTWREGMGVEIVHSRNSGWESRKGKTGRLTLKLMIALGDWAIEFDGDHPWVINDNTEIKFVSHHTK